MFASAKHSPVLFPSARTASPGVGACRSLFLSLLACSGLAGAGQDDAFATAQLQLQRMTKASLMVQYARNDGFAQLRDSQEQLARAVATLEGDTFEECASHVPAPQTAQKLRNVTVQLPPIVHAAEVMLKHEVTWPKMHAAADAIADASTGISELLLELSQLQAKSRTRSAETEASGRILFLNARLGGSVMRLVHDEGSSHELAFDIGRSATQIRSGMDNLLNGSKEAGISPATAKEKAKMKAIMERLATQYVGVMALMSDLGALIEFKGAALDVFDEGEKMSEALARIHAGMLRDKVCRVDREVLHAPN